MAKIVSIHPERSRLIFLDELPPLNSTTILRLIEPMFPHPKKYKSMKNQINKGKAATFIQTPSGSHAKNLKGAVKWPRAP